MATEIFTVTPLDIGIGSPAIARELMRRATEDGIDEGVRTDAILLVSELVTDVAVAGSARTLALTIRITDHVLWAGVEATGVGPTLDKRSQLLDMLASQWGVVDRYAEGAVELTWFEIQLDRSDR